jgi:hypothetical protein
MTEVSASCVARAILEYLHQNRQAQDTLAGITEWWLPKQKLAPQMAIVREALALLMADDLIVGRAKTRATFVLTNTVDSD